MATEETPLVGVSFLSRLIDDDRQPLSLHERLVSEDDNYSTDSTFGNFWKTFYEDFIKEEEQKEDEAPLPTTSPF
jgi:hypothetical protein